MKPIDERQVMFARLRYAKGTTEHESYYAIHPEQLEQDEAFRLGPGFGSEGTMTFDSVISPFTTAGFDVLAGMHGLTMGLPNAVKVEVAPEKLTTHIKRFSAHLGAAAVGICPMAPHYYYGVKGRGGRYGLPVDDPLPNGIVFLVEMPETLIDRTPQLESAFAVTKGYMDAAIIGIWIAQYLRNLGYKAKAHMDGHYDVNCPMVAEGAGLGQIGRIGILVNPVLGPRVRIGVVTTDAPLNYDTPMDFDLKAFCEHCNRCSRTCPGKAISKEAAENFDGFSGWNTDQEACYGVWTRLGTDCGICMSSCPFSHNIPETDIVRWKTEQGHMDAVLEDYEQRYGIRPYIKHKLPLVLED